MLLSICIPTYNRKKYLVETLRHVLSQLDSYRNEVELLISDNCSPDSPEREIRDLEFQYKFPIKFIRQEENIGLEPNFIYLIENSKGDYIHVLGDDDLLAPNFYATLLPFLRQKRYGMICTGVMCSRDIDCREIVIKDSAFIRMLDEEPPSEFIKRIMWIGGLISSVIISRAAWNLGKDTETTRYKLYQTFAKELYGIIKLGSPCLFYSMPLLIQRCGQKHTFIGELLDSTILGRANLFKDLDNASPGIYKIFKEKELSTSQLAMTTSLMIYNRKHYRTQIKEYREHLKRKQYAWLYFWLYTPFPRLMRSILLPFVWLYNRWIQPRGANAFK